MRIGFSIRINDKLTELIIMNKLLTGFIASVLLAAGSMYGQIEVNENFTVTGFFDMSATSTDDDSGSSSSYNFDQAEIDFILSFEDVTGQVDLNYLGDNSTGDFSLEQAFITYDLDNGSSVSAGKFLSYHGWETAEPTGLFQYSYAYDLMGTIPGYHNGVTYDYSDDFVTLGLGLLDSVYSADGSIQDSEYGIEAKAVFTPAEGLTLYLGLAKDSMDTGPDKDLINFWASYEVGDATYAVEYNTYDFGSVEGNQWLVMGNWALSDTFGITARVSDDAIDGGESAMKYTLSPGWTVGENLGMLFEISETDFDTMGSATSFAFETIFSF